MAEADGPRVIVDTTNEYVNAFIEKFMRPRIEHQIETALPRLIEEIVEKKIGERFAFAVELLKPKPAKVFCNSHPDVEALIYTDGPGPVKAHCVWCIRQEAVENFKKTAGIMAGANGAS